MDYPHSSPKVGLHDGRFTDGSADGTIKPSLDPAAWANAVTDEIKAVIIAGGLVPTEGSNTQMAAAIALLIAADLPNATTALKGKVELATIAEAVAGVASDLAVTPDGLAAALAANPSLGAGEGLEVVGGLLRAKLADTTLLRGPTGLAVNTAALGLTACKNMLINTHFVGAVNQRGYASGAATTSANQYTIDRWRVVTSGQSLSWAAGVLTAPAGGAEQVIEGLLIPRSGTYTISWTGTATCTVDGAAKTSGQTVNLTSGTNCTVRFSGGTVQYPQLEYGAAASGYEVLPLDWTLRRCLRYFWKVSPTINVGYGIGYGTASNFETVVYFPEPMRTIPSVGSTGNAADYGYYALSGTGAGYSTPTISNGGTVMFCNVQINVSSPPSTGRWEAHSTTSFLTFSAEL
jgi:hypothetical protein